MAISQISPSSLTTATPYVNPFSRTTEQPAASQQQGNQDGQQAVKATKSDTVSISREALQMIGGNSENKSEETKGNKENTPGNRSGSVEIRA